MSDQKQSCSKCKSEALDLTPFYDAIEPDSVKCMTCGHLMYDDDIVTNAKKQHAKILARAHDGNCCVEGCTELIGTYSRSRLCTTHLAMIRKWETSNRRTPRPLIKTSKRTETLRYIENPNRKRRNQYHYLEDNKSNRVYNSNVL